MAQAEVDELAARQTRLEEELRALLLPRDPNDDRNVFVEIRAGAGGDEAGLFAADLTRMYTKYAERQRWKVEVMDSHPTGVGGFKEIILFIQGRGAWSRLKFERGVHRVQRVPATESSGRIHTSTVTVAVLPEAEDVDVKVEEKDLRVDVYRSSGPGGQGVNTTDSAVRLTHLPTGLVVTCQDERSQIKNRAKAMRVLKARLLERAQDEQAAAIAADRRSQVGTGERSERIRTYNFPQARVSDHRIGLTLHKLPAMMEGDLDELIDGAHRVGPEPEARGDPGVTTAALPRRPCAALLAEAGRAPGRGGAPHRAAGRGVAARRRARRGALRALPGARTRGDGRRRRSLPRPGGAPRRHEPLQHLLGFEDFRGLRLRVDARRARAAAGDRRTGRVGAGGSSNGMPPTGESGHFWPSLMATSAPGSGAIACALAASARPDAGARDGRSRPARSRWRGQRARARAGGSGAAPRRRSARAAGAGAAALDSIVANPAVSASAGDHRVAAARGRGLRAARGAGRGPGRPAGACAGWWRPRPRCSGPAAGS